jgi:hypothetical protein
LLPCDFKESARHWPPVLFISDWAMFGIRWLSDPLETIPFQGAIMAKDSHQRAAEFHNLAAHAHQAAVTHHGKEDHLTGHELSRQAMEYAAKAFEFSKAAHKESGAFAKQKKSKK